MPQGSAIATAPPKQQRVVHRTRRVHFLIFIFSLHEINFNVNSPRAILLSVTDPHLSQFLPVFSVSYYREPRPGHKVDPFESQAGPEVVESDALDGAARDEWLQVVAFHFKFMPTVERNDCLVHFGADLARLIDDS